jgi:hypothetical protein
MKLAIVGSRSITDYDLAPVIPEGVTEIVSGGARGIDRVAEKYATDNNIKFTVFLPDYDSYGRAAPIIRNRDIIAYADNILAIWDGDSKGTRFMINESYRQGKLLQVVSIFE